MAKYKHKFYTKANEAIIAPYKALSMLPENMTVVKLRGEYAFKFAPESEGKTRYMIASVNQNGEFKNLGILKQYEAVVQLKQLFTQYPKVLRRKAYIPNKDGSMSKQFMELIGTNAIKEHFEDVPTLQEAKAFMNAKFAGKIEDYMS
tara:strand:- start:939 stop:1379 length:441 start_codon:yes stop_codon:yes gene_type:complete